jgi:hypothetical protein
VDTIKTWIARLTQSKHPQPSVDNRQSPRDFTTERETTRAGQLNAEDQAWESDRKQRNQERHNPE